MKGFISGKALTALCVLAVLCSWGRPASAAAAKKAQLSCGVHFSTSGSLGSSQQKEFTDILKGIAAENGITVVLKQFKSNKEAAAAFLANRLDMALLWPEDMLPIWDKGSSYSQWGTYTVAKKKQRSYCLWQLKSRGTPVAADLAKSTLFNENDSLLNYLRLRDFLFSKGIDKPVWKVFKSIVRTPSQNSAFMALSMGKGDFFWDSDDWDSLLKVMNSGQAVKLKHPLCSDPGYDRSGVIINRKTVPKENYGSLVNILRDFEGDKLDAYMKSKPELQSFRQMTKLAKIQFTLGDPGAYGMEKALYGKAKKNGWLGEAKFFMAHFAKTPVGSAMAIKSDFAYCKSSCGGSKTQEKCIEKCMSE